MLMSPYYTYFCSYYFQSIICTHIYIYYILYIQGAVKVPLQLIFILLTDEMFIIYYSIYYASSTVSEPVVGFVLSCILSVQSIREFESILYART